MSTRKTRVTVTVDTHLYREAERLVDTGEADSISWLLNRGLAEVLGRERRRRALDEAIAYYEKTHGAITPEEVQAQREKDLRNAIVYKPRKHRRRVA